MFDFSTSKEKKGRLTPNRGTIFRLSNYEMLTYSIGHRELRQVTDGHPRELIISVHKDSTFKDIKYLSSQLYCFAALLLTLGIATSLIHYQLQSLIRI